MTEWIADNVDKEGIDYVLHTGDIVDEYDSFYQWDNAVLAMNTLDGVVPVFTIAGNHDIHSGDHEYENYLNFFGEDKYGHLDTVGGWYKGGRGRYDLLDVNGEDIILISVGYSVVTEDLEWINDTLETYRDRTAILAVHGYMDPDESYTSDGKYLSRDVVAVNENIKMVLCGHRHGTHHNSVSFDDDGDGVDDRTVYQVLFNGQTEKYYGGGYMCFMTFDNDEINVSYYSPYFDESKDGFMITWDN